MVGGRARAAAGSAARRADRRCARHAARLVGRRGGPHVRRAALLRHAALRQPVVLALGALAAAAAVAACLRRRRRVWGVPGGSRSTSPWSARCCCSSPISSSSGPSRPPIPRSGWRPASSGSTRTFSSARQRGAQRARDAGGYGLAVWSHQHLPARRVVPARADRLRDARAPDRRADGSLVRRGLRGAAAGGHVAPAVGRRDGCRRRRARVQPRLPRRRAAAVRPAALRAPDGSSSSPRWRESASPPARGRRASPRSRHSGSRRCGRSSRWRSPPWCSPPCCACRRGSLRVPAASGGWRASGARRPRAACAPTPSSPARRSRRRATCPTGRGTSPTCASSCSGASATSPTTSALDPGAAVGVAYLASAAAIAELVRRRGRIVERERAALVAVDRHDGVRDRAAQLLRRPLAGPHPRPRRTAGRADGRALARPAAARARHPSPAARAGGLGFALAVAALVVAWPGPRSASASRARRRRSRPRAAGRCTRRSTASGTRRRWPARARRRAGAGAPHARPSRGPDDGRLPTWGSRSSCAAAAWTGCSSAIRGRRASSPGELPRLAARVAALRPGERMLLDAASARGARPAARHPSLDPLSGPSHPARPAPAMGAASGSPSASALRPVAPDRGGFRVVELVPDA